MNYLYCFYFFFRLMAYIAFRFHIKHHDLTMEYEYDIPFNNPELNDLLEGLRVHNNLNHSSFAEYGVVYVCSPMRNQSRFYVLNISYFNLFSSKMEIMYHNVRNGISKQTRVISYEGRNSTIQNLLMQNQLPFDPDSDFSELDPFENSEIVLRGNSPLRYHNEVE